jgi:hypothetical protein
MNNTLRNVASTAQFYTVLTFGNAGNQRQEACSLIGVCMSTRSELYQQSSICEWKQIEVRTLTSLLSVLAHDAGCRAYVNSTNMETF